MKFTQMNKYREYISNLTFYIPKFPKSWNDVSFKIKNDKMVRYAGNMVILIGIDVNKAFYKTGNEMIQ